MRTGNFIPVDKMSIAACRMFLIPLVFIGNPIFAESTAAKVPLSDKKQASVKKADADTLKLVEFFLKTPIVDLPPNAIGAFMAVDPQSLPAKQQVPYLAKKEELLAIKNVSDGKKKPPIRRLNMEAPPANECLPEGPNRAQVLALAGYGKITEDDERYLMEKTKCTECELITEFTLRIVQEKSQKKDSAPKLFYFLHGRDPLMVLVGAHHAGVKNPFGTNFFGTGNPACH